VIISQVVPFPWDTSRPVVAQYTAALQNFDSAAKPGFVSLEGYIVGRLAIAALEATGKDLTRESYLQAMANLSTVDLGGVSMIFGEGDNQGMDDVFLTRITADGGFEPLVVSDGS
jgi:ABC-type branched-subunit amino acid transport system substrate-binding protein